MPKSRIAFIEGRLEEMVERRMQTLVAPLGRWAEAEGVIQKPEGLYLSIHVKIRICIVRPEGTEQKTSGTDG